MTNHSVIAYLGYGAFAKQLEQMLREIKSPLANAQAYYFDDYAYRDGIKNAFPFNEYINPRFDDCEFLIAIGYNHLPEKFNVIQKLRNKSRKILSIVHPGTILSPSAIIEEGCIIFPGCIIEMNTVIHSGSVLYDGCVVAHDSTVGACSFLAPRVTIAGRTQIGERSFLGVGCVVINDIICGNDCTIGANSLVQKSLSSHTNGIGNPLHIVQHKKIEL